MNIQAYIESGILEEYVLGSVSPQEKQEVECMSHIYPEIKAELMKTEDALEQYALKHQTAPPQSLKDSILSQMNFDQPVMLMPDDVTPDVSSAHVVTESTFGTSEEDAKGPATDIIVPSSGASEARVLTPAWAKMSLAASVLLGLFAAWSAVEMKSLKSDIALLAGDKQELAFQIETVKSMYAYKASLAGMYGNPDFKVVRMTGIPAKSPESEVAAFWNQKTNEVILDVQRLPAAPSGKQYQLWSIVNGVPVDIGMLDEKFMGKILKMKPTKTGAAAFAITLEKTGGSPTPTLEEMYVMGKV